MIKDIIGFEKYYTISSTGIITTTKTGHIKKPTLNKSNGYLTIDLYKNNSSTKLYIHRLVAEHFCTNPLSKPQVNHINGNKLDNQLDNLEWVTHQENAIHAVTTGLKVYTNRLNYSEFVQILDDIIYGESYQSVCLRVPYKVPFLSTKIRRIAKDLGKEHLLDKSLALQKRLRTIKSNKSRIK